jgi:hypothetical protein
MSLFHHKEEKSAKVYLLAAFVSLWLLQSHFTGDEHHAALRGV